MRIIKMDPRIRIYSETTVENMINYCSKFAEVFDMTVSNVESMRGWIVKGVEIFKAGTYRKIPYEESALDEMAANFKTLKDAGTFEPVFKKNHSESIDDQVGWIVNVFRDGDFLKGDIHITDWSTYDKIQDGTWKFVSSEIYPPDLAAEEFDGAVSGHVLRGVAIVSIPKVKGLKGIVLNSEIIEQGGNEMNREKILAMLAKLGINFTEQEAATLTEEQLEERLTAKFAELQTPAAAPVIPAAPAAPGTQVFSEGQAIMIKADDFTAMVQKMAGSEQKNIDLFAEVAALKNESKATKIERKVSALMQAGKMTPAEKEGVVAFAEKLEGQSFEDYFATLEKRAPVVDLSEHGGPQGGDPDDDDKAWAAFQELNKQKTFE